MVGFNRRFAPAFSRLRGWVDLCPGPVSLQVTVNAGPLAPDHWYANHGESGGRLIGEGCHFVDLALALARTPPVSVVAFSLAGPGARRDDAFHLQIRFADGSSAQIAYQTRGEPGAPKETITLAAEGVVAVCRDFLAVESWTNKGHRVEKFHSKGHREEMTAWVTHLEKGGEPPLPVAGLFLSMEMVFAAAASLQSGGVVEIVGGEA
jgi:predicted dehydrogenase